MGRVRETFICPGHMPIMTLENWQIPILDIDGQQIGQSATIARYIAKKYGFAGSNDVEAGQSFIFFC